MGVYGEIIYQLSDLNEILHQSASKTNDRGEFELDRARSKNNIAENLFALGHETDNKNILAYLPLAHQAAPASLSSAVPPWQASTPELPYASP